MFLLTGFKSLIALSASLFSAAAFSFFSAALVSKDGEGEMCAREWRASIQESTCARKHASCNTGMRGTHSLVHSVTHFPSPHAHTQARTWSLLFSAADLLFSAADLLFSAADFSAL